MPTIRMIAIEAAVVRRLSQSASSAPGSPRLAISSAGLRSTKIATIGSVRKVSATASAEAEQQREPGAASSRGAGPKPASSSASAQAPLGEPVDELAGQRRAASLPSTTPAP